MSERTRRQAEFAYGSLPEELQELIAHTDRGVKRLYATAAGTSRDSSLDATISRSRGKRRAERLPSNVSAHARGLPRRQHQETRRPQLTDAQHRRRNTAVNSCLEYAEDKGEEETSRSETPGTSLNSSSTQEGLRQPSKNGIPRKGGFVRTPQKLPNEVTKRRGKNNDAGVREESAADRSASHGRHGPQPTCSLVERYRQRHHTDASAFSEDSQRQGARDLSYGPPSTAATEASSVLCNNSGGVWATPRQPSPKVPLTPSTTGTKQPALSTPSAGTQSLFLSVDKSGLAETNTDSSAIGGLRGNDMRTRFGQKWNRTFQALFGGDEVVSAGNKPSQAVSPTSQEAAMPAAGHVVENNPLLQVPPSQHQQQHQNTMPQPESTPAVSTAHVVTDEGESRQLNGALVVRLREELREREQEMVKLRLDHALEMATLNERIAEARREGAAEASQEAAATSEVRQDVLRSALHVEQQRVTDARNQMEDLRREKLAVEERLQALEAKVMQYERTAGDLEVAQEASKKLRDSLAEAVENHNRARRDLEGTQRELTKRENAIDALNEQVRDLEKQLLSQEESARDTLRRLEEEFTITTNSYQQLLTEATERMSKLEKTQRKYKTLREVASALKEDSKESKAKHEAQENEWAAEKVRLSEKLRAAQEEAGELQIAMRELSATHDTAVTELRRQCDAQKLSSSDQTKLLQTQLDTANHTIQLLRTQVESVKADLAEEQVHTQEIAMRMAETELRLQEEKQGQQRAAGSYKVQTEETLSILRRQLKEKDAQLKALAASLNEPLQRVRRQLEEERGRRAHLEDQFAQYKRKAKEAEEAALLEIRREKLRNAALISPRGTPTVKVDRAASGGLRRASSGFAPQLSAHGQSAMNTPKPWHSAISTTRAPTQPQQQLSTLQPTEDAHSPPPVQTTTIADSLPSEVPPQRRDAHHPPTADTLAFSPSQHDTRRASLRDVSSSSNAAPPTVQLFANRNDTSERSGGVSTPPNPGVDSISGITLNSPCKSASDGALDVAPVSGDRPVRHVASSRPAAVACQDDSPPQMPPPAPALVLNEESQREGVTRERRPWHQFASAAAAAAASSSQKKETRFPSAAEGGAEKGAVLISPVYSAVRTPAPLDEEDGQQLRTHSNLIIAEQERESTPSGDHERRMRDFHVSAAQVFQKITASRDDFMAQCSAIVRQAMPAQRRSNRKAPASTADSASVTGGEDDSSFSDA